MKAFFTIAGLLFIANGANAFGWGLLGGGGGGCGCSAPPPPAPCAAPPPPPPPPMPQMSCAPAPQPACPPPPPPCPPPPPPPPPQACPAPAPCPPCQPPPPPPCPPPPPPQPCPPPPPAPICPAPAPVQCPAPPPPPPQQPAHNDCCNSCASPCRFRSRKVFGALVADRNVNAMCNNEKLRNIILDNIKESTTESKRAIQKAAEDKLEGKYDVICAAGEFSYIVHSNTFCQDAVNGITCYAFRH